MWLQQPQSQQTAQYHVTDLEADLQQLSPLEGVILERVLQHGLESSPLAVRVIPQEAKARVQIIHTVLDWGATQAPAPPCLSA